LLVDERIRIRTKNYEYGTLHRKTKHNYNAPISPTGGNEENGD
jgi:hypothetical protein